MKEISSRDNPLIKQLRQLASSSRARRELQQSLLDGPHLLEAALDRSWPIVRVVVSQQGSTNGEIGQLLERCSGAIECVRVPDRLFAQLSPVDAPSGVLAQIDLPDPAPLALDGDLLLLEGIQDPGNLGSILRTAAAAGLEEVLLSAGCAGAWSPRCLRAGMGAHFVLRLHEQVDLSAAIEDYPGQVVATALGASATDLYATDLRPPTAWLFGGEGQGLSASLLSRAQLRLIIPIASAIESLNVGAAVAACLFEQQRQRRAER